MNKEQITELAAVYGFVDMGEQKSKYMYSYRNTKYRMNVYHTTGTVTFQLLENQGGWIETSRGVDLEALEHLLESKQRNTP
jgi:hypothetical protein